MYTHYDSPSISPYPAVPMKYALIRAADSLWSDSDHSGLQQRDYPLAEGSSGQMGSLHYRASAPGRVQRWADPNEFGFTFLFVISGELVIVTEAGDRVTLTPGDTACQSALTQNAPVEWSADFSAIEITAPARGVPKPEPVDLLRFEDHKNVNTLEEINSLINRDIPANYEQGGLRSFMAYRDLRTIAATERRIHIHDVAVSAPALKGTGWHVHSMSQIFYVLRGWIDLSVDGQAPTRLVEGDAMCVANGMRHDVPVFSSDYRVLEMCLPADYSTTPTPPPEGYSGVPMEGQRVDIIR